MSTNESPATTVATDVDPKPQGYLGRCANWFWKTHDSVGNAKPLNRTLIVLTFTVCGVAASEAYEWVKGRFVGPDEYLVQIKEQQSESFKRLEDQLSTLSRNVDGNGRDTLNSVERVVAEIRSANEGLVAQLALARREYDRLALSTAKERGIRGGYDFILNPSSGLRIDASTVIGVDYIGDSVVDVNLSANGLEQERTVRLDSGESIAYRSASGQACRVTLMSIQSREAASFAISCGVS
jgi:hypothetical protein